MLWVDKYRPHSLDKVMVHVQEAQHLKNLVKAAISLDVTFGIVWSGGVRVSRPYHSDEFFAVD